MSGAVRLGADSAGAQKHQFARFRLLEPWFRREFAYIASLCTAFVECHLIPHSLIHHHPVGNSQDGACLEIVVHKGLRIKCTRIRSQAINRETLSRSIQLHISANIAAVVRSFLIAGGLHRLGRSFGRLCGGRGRIVVNGAVDGAASGAMILSAVILLADFTEHMGLATVVLLTFRAPC